MYLSVILPCFHPPQGWAVRVAEVYHSLEARLGAPFELVLVDDGNRDFLQADELTILRQEIPPLREIHYDENHGKGYALRRGVAAATGDILIYTDVDFPYTEDSFMALYEALRTNDCDVAAGIKDQAYYTQVPHVRRFISRNLRSMIKLLLRLPVTDTQCGLKGFRAAVKPLFLQTTIDRYLFDLEFLHQCFKRQAGLRVKAIPVALRPGVVFRKMNLRILFPELMNFLRILGRK